MKHGHVGKAKEEKENSYRERRLNPEKNFTFFRILFRLAMHSLFKPFIFLNDFVLTCFKFSTSVFSINKLQRARGGQGGIE